MASPERSSYNPAEYSADSEIDDINHVFYAMEDSGLDASKAPKPGTPAYKRLDEASANYMIAISKSMGKNQAKPSWDTEDERRIYHEELCMLLFGRRRSELSKREKDQASNFAAHLRNHPELVDKWAEA